MPGRPIPRSCVLKLPAQRRSVEMVHAILDGAVAVLIEEGTEGFSTNTVAARAGVSIGSLYQYFAHKDMLMGAVVERAVLEIEEMVRATAASDERPLEEVLPDLASQVIDLCQPHRELIRMALYTSPLLGTGIAAVLETRLMDVARSYLERHVDRYKVEGGRATLYVALNSATYVLLKWIAEEPPGVSKDELISAATSQLLSNIKRLPDAAAVSRRRTRKA